MAFDAFEAAGLDFGTFSGIGDGTHRRLPRAAGRPPRRARRDARHRRRPPPVGRGDVHEPAVGVARHLHADDIDFMTEPFADEARLRAGWAVYQLFYGRPMAEAPIIDRTVDIPTLILYGPDDHVVREDFIPFAEVAYTDRIGPLVVPGAGHFLQWERADIFNPLVAATLLFQRRSASRPRPTLAGCRSRWTGVVSMDCADHRRSPSSGRACSAARSCSATDAPSSCGRTGPGCPAQGRRLRAADVAGRRGAEQLHLDLAVDLTWSRGRRGRAPRSRLADAQPGTDRWRGASTRPVTRFCLTTECCPRSASPVSA